MIYVNSYITATLISVNLIRSITVSVETITVQINEIHICYHQYLYKNCLLTLKFFSGLFNNNDSVGKIFKMCHPYFANLSKGSHFGLRDCWTHLW